MSEVEVKVVSSGKEWAGIKKGDLLKVAKVEANDRGVYAWLEDTFPLDGKPEKDPADEIPF